MPDPHRFLDTALPLADRVGDLLARRTLAEKLAQLRNAAPAGAGHPAAVQPVFTVKDLTGASRREAPVRYGP